MHFLHEEDRQVLRVLGRELLQRSSHLLHVVERGVDERASAPELRADVLERRVLRVEQIEGVLRALRLPGASPRLGDDGGDHRARPAVLVARQIDRVDELAGRVDLALRQVDERALETRLIGLGGHRFREIDRLELALSGVRIVLHQQLRLGERRGEIALLEILVELLERGLPARFVGRRERPEDVGDGLRLLQPTPRPEREPAGGGRQRAHHRVRDPMIHERRDDPRRQQRQAEPQAQALQHLARIGHHRFRRRGRRFFVLLRHGRPLPRTRRGGGPA